jgi:hypothetical protein
MAFSRPGKRTHNAFVESFNVTFRAEYKEILPHRAFGEKIANEFAKEIATSRDFLGQQTTENSP